jgi:hypothetical protein
VGASLSSSPSKAPEKAVRGDAPRIGLPGLALAGERGDLGAAVLTLRARAFALGSLLLACTPKDTASVTPDPAPIAGDSPSAEPAAAPEPPVPEPAPEPAPASLRVAREGPLTEAQRAVFFGSPDDDVPPRRNGILGMHEEEHYITGNERTLDLYHPLIEDLGGGYLGVGTDQAYLLVDWARSDVAWLIDYDAEVQVVHELYRRFFLAAQGPEEFLALWSRDGRAAAKAVLEAEVEPARARQLVTAYDTYRAEIDKRLAKVKQRMQKVALPCYLTDAERYQHLRTMLEEGRIRPMLANLLDDRAILGIAEAARALEVPIRVLYLSNAEQYWRRYEPQYRQNIAALPFDDDAVLLRTLLRVSIDKDFHYNVQPAKNYVQWLQAPYVRYVYDITGRPEYVKGELSFFRSDGDPEKTPLARRFRAAEARRSAAGG